MVALPQVPLPSAADLRLTHLRDQDAQGVWRHHRSGVLHRPSRRQVSIGAAITSTHSSHRIRHHIVMALCAGWGRVQGRVQDTDTVDMGMDMDTALALVQLVFRRHRGCRLGRKGHLVVSTTSDLGPLIFLPPGGNLVDL